MRRLPALALAACTAATLAPVLHPDTASAGAPPAVNLVANPSFGANPSLARWTCDDRVEPDTLNPGVEFLQVGPRDDVEPLAAGSATGYVPPRMPIPIDYTTLVGSPTATQRARCSQVVPVRPGSTYTLSVTVNEGEVVLGSDYGSVQTPGPNGPVTELRTTFTTAAGADRVRIYVQGNLGGPAYELDDVVLTGPDSTSRVPAAPAGLIRHQYTGRALMLQWTGSPGATRYRVYRDGNLVGTTSNVWLPVLGLTAGRNYRFVVEAVNAAGASARVVLVTQSAPAYTAPPPAPWVQTAEATWSGDVQLGWTSAKSATDGHHVYVDGLLAGWVPGQYATVPDLAPGTYTIEVTALNSAGESVRSDPVIVTV